MTVAPTSAPVTSKVGLGTFVVLSVGFPESLAAWRSGALGVRALVSIVAESDAETGPLLPAA